MNRTRSCLLLAAALNILSGCAIGYDTALFMTKSNFGLDVDSKPPTAEISIARREGVLEPAFDGETLPVAGGFSSKGSPLSNYLFGVSSIFAGGDAANIVTNLDDESGLEDEKSDRLCLAEKPKGRLLFWTFDSLAPRPNEVQPLAFGTDTTLGIKLAWSGLTAQFPDTIRVGFQRKELAISPVSGRQLKEGEQCENTLKRKGNYEVWMPSFLAWINTDANVGKTMDTKVGYAQGFATGKAADHWANIPTIKELVLKRSVGDVIAATTFNRDPEAIVLSARIDKWLKANDANRQKLKTWLIDNKMIKDQRLAVASWLSAAPKEQLQKAISAEDIP